MHFDTAEFAELKSKLELGDEMTVEALKKLVQQLRDENRQMKSMENEKLEQQSKFIKPSSLNDLNRFY